jgi:hypothetical protein
VVVLAAPAERFKTLMTLFSDRAAASLLFAAMPITRLRFTVGAKARLVSQGPK